MSQRDRGSATVETALALICVLLFVVAGIGAIVAVTHRLGCVARARDTALAAARGEDIPPSGDGSAHRASVEYGNDGTVTATVRTPVTSCVATAAVEP